MTLNDFLKRIDIEKDKDKMLIHYNADGIGWSNLEIKVCETEIKLLPDKCNSPFSSDK